MIEGSFEEVDPKGTYLFVDTSLDENGNQYDSANIPSFIDLLKFGLLDYDYIGLRQSGFYSDGSGSGIKRTGLVGVFADNFQYLLPPNFGYNDEAITEATYDNNIPTEILKDFLIRDWEQTIVRVPRGAKYLFFTANDSKYRDNTNTGKFGVYITTPNNSFHIRQSNTEKNVLKNIASAHDDGEVFTEEELSAIYKNHDPLKNAIAKDIIVPGEPVPPNTKPPGKPDPFLPVSTRPPVPIAQYRGWYPGPSKWEPEFSKFGGRPHQANKHAGIDIFSPINTPVVASIQGANLRWNIGGYKPKWGNYVTQHFAVNGREFVIVLAHLSKLLAVDNQPVLLGQEIALSGDSGNATSNGIDLHGVGGRSDHIHVELNEVKRTIVSGNLVIKWEKINPVKYLPWGYIATPH